MEEEEEEREKRMDLQRSDRQQNIVRNKKTKKVWSEISEDILSLIPTRLGVGDRIRFSATCKAWQSASADCLQPQLPWIMEFLYNKRAADPPLYLLYEPRHIGINNTPPHVVKDERAAKLLSGATLYGSRFGWVFCTKTVHNGLKVTYFYVYNPLTRRIISLPKFKWQRKHRERDFEINYATFTADPTSAQCEFIVTYVCNMGGVHMSSYRSKGGKQWHTRSVTPSHEFFFPRSRMAYADGMLYCFNEEGALSSYDVGAGNWNLLGKPWDRNISKHRPYDGGTRSPNSIMNIVVTYFLVYGGNLHLIEEGERIDRDWSSYCNVYRFDRVSSNWEMMESLEGGVIFLNRCLSSFSFGMLAEELREKTEVTTKMEGNRVYYFDRTFNLRFHMYGPQEREPPAIVEEGQEQEEYRDMINWDTPTLHDSAHRRIWIPW